MNGKFVSMTEKYRKKYYPEGYFAATAKSNTSAGIGVMVIGAIMALMGGAGVFFVLRFFLTEFFNGGADTSDIPGMLFLLAFPGFFLLLGAFFVYLGIQKKGMGLGDSIQASVEASGYPESIIRDFDRQVSYPDTVVFQLKGDGTKGILTKDYICSCLSSVIIKREDIKAVYLVEQEQKISVRNSVKTIYSLNLEILSKHGTCCGIVGAKKQSVNDLIAMLKETNPDIDTAGGKVFSENEFETLKNKLKNI